VNNLTFKIKNLHQHSGFIKSSKNTSWLFAGTFGVLGIEVPSSSHDNYLNTLLLQIELANIFQFFYFEREVILK